MSMNYSRIQLVRFLAARSTVRPPALGGADNGLTAFRDRRGRHFSTVYSNDDDDDSDRGRDDVGNDPGEDYPRQKTALIIGSSGCVGRVLSQYLSSELDMRVVGADVAEPSDDKDWGIDDFCALPFTNNQAPPPLAAITTSLTMGMADILGENGKIDAIICASGGFETDPEFPRPGADIDAVIQGAQEYGESIDRMFHRNLYPVLAAGYLANRFMANEGLFVVMGAASAMLPTPGMMGYGISKAGAHHFIQTLGETTGKAATTVAKRKAAMRLRKHSEYLDSLSVIGLIPDVLDTPANREAMPDSDFAKWTDPRVIAKEIGMWVQSPALRPHSGSLIRVTSNYKKQARFFLAR